MRLALVLILAVTAAACGESSSAATGPGRARSGPVKFPVEVEKGRSRNVPGHIPVATRWPTQPPPDVDHCRRVGRGELRRQRGYVDKGHGVQSTPSRRPGPGAFVMLQNA